MKFNFNSFFILVYKIVGFLLLSFCAFAVVMYATLFVFYVFNRNWAEPVILSPAQQSVLSFQPQILSLEAGLNTQKIALETAEETKAALSEQISKLEGILGRTDKAMLAESDLSSKTGRELGLAVIDKKENLRKTKDMIATINGLISHVDQDLKAGLITKEDAGKLMVSLQAALNSAAEGRAVTVQLDEMVERLQHGAQTLQGGNSSLQAMMAVTQQAQLRAVFTQMKIQLKTAIATASALKKSIAEAERVIKLAQISPFYQATRKTVNVLFVPYDNIGRAEVGAAVYDCYLQIFACYQVGTIKTVFDAEQYSRHPLFRTEIKGQYVEVDIDGHSAKSSVVFIGRKPLFL